MKTTIRATITFDYYVDEDEVLAELTEQEQIDYVRESTVEDIMNMNFGNSNDLYNAIEIEIIKEN